MGRPRLYHTPEQKSQARKETLKRYYVKHCAQIRRQARRRFKRAQKSLQQELEKQPIAGAIETPDPLELDNDDPLKVIASAQGHFEKLTRGSISGYLSEVVERCLNDIDGSKEYCQVTSSVWDSFLHDVQDTLSSVLQEYGCRPEYDVGEATHLDIRHVIGLIAEVEELLLSSPSQLWEWHALGRLAYQNL
ncbi:uncharacterized protein LACBIDRAFT_330686 [Laccaria bicolor S238N-H82]|uniref:Predicted protein n=1 Tax=Laccaria bicolor (strain S238N-H82 / ATCC MYA-4686) TaxID=486041 RepID=B0DM47_LACBS|nr:uncharacterized protein LACBIDRAFT_330686 [Laccaria bicolor S238N-H82]EDR04409.1 predicted protein [Laccaria bicolor S238N-H82]|eukprot:XP_001884928.1 predicted protein [Laccaria bicolor S238N-H82]